MDRDEIERQDFPAARRGYDADAVHEHLRRVADELEALAARPRSASLAEGTSTQVRSILEAAESSAQQLRDDAGREASEHVERVGEAAKELLGKLERVQGELDRLLTGLRSTAESLAGSLDELSRDVGALGGAKPAERRFPRRGARARRERRALRRRCRRAARRAQHGARGHAARGDRPLPGGAFRARRRGDVARRRLRERGQVSAAPAELAALHERAAILADLGHVHSLLFWDQNTMMPPHGASARGDHSATLESVTHERLTDPELGRLLDVLEPWAAGEDPDADDVRLVRELRRDFEKAVRVPTSLAAELSRAAAHGQAAWQEARAAADFSRFRDAMERQIELRHRYVDCFTGFEHRYDALLDDFEPGMTTAALRPAVRRVVGGARAAAGRRQRQPSAGPRAARSAARTRSSTSAGR